MNWKIWAVGAAVAGAAWWGVELDSEASSPVNARPVATEVQKTTRPGRVGPNVGDIAPEIAMPNPKGKEMRLSDLRGKLVLVDRVPKTIAQRLVANWTYRKTSI